ncbi:type 1 glutamine amidotransferase [Salinibacter altiplanensis]|uniref:type 1 glutamine amidotransferase n=1 Tax=Salinibacter altiplanensis TaxID=1803181 RepID=UPI000C9F577B|nr:type 1 glutamine amidotransferase [Salinibacter altiplanensis]
MHLALIDASLGTPHAQRNFDREVDASLTVYNANEGEMPPPIGAPAPDHTDSEAARSFDGAIISGSQSSVYDSHRPWIQELSRWVEGAISDGLPILGVCWGHQLLAQILGGTVRGGSYELGYVEVQQEKDDPIWNGLPAPFTAFATHSDHVVKMPSDAHLLASNETGVQALRYEQVYGVQFHPEYDLETAKAMIRSKDLPERTVQRALDTCTDANVDATGATTHIFDNFLRHVAATASTAPSSAPNA